MAEGPEAAGVVHINAYCKKHFKGVLECRWTENKGRVVHAVREFAVGEEILVEPPLHVVQEDDVSAAFNKVKELCSDRAGDMDYEPLWYWCALQSLTQAELKGAREGGWQGTDEATQKNLLLLHHEEVEEPGAAAKILAQELAPSADPMVLERLIQIWVLNCFEYSDSPQGYSTYFYSSFMSHSCFPNAVWYYDGTDHALRARRAIKVGDEVCISYLPEHGLLQSAPARRSELHDTKRFWCACERCSGELDLSRGFVCPACKEGKVFAHTPGNGPTKDSSLQSVHIVDGTCDTCKHAISKAEAKTLWTLETKLQKAVDALTQSNEDDEGAASKPEELSNTEKLIDDNFAQHVLADLAWEQLAACYSSKRRHADHRRILARRCAFHDAAYPGLNGAYAWALEANADALMRAGGDAESGERRGKGQRQGEKRVCQVSSKKDPEAAKRLYLEALDILAKMFGEKHEYYTDVEEKYKKLEVA